MRNLRNLFAILVIAVIAFSSCKPYQEKIYVEIAPNQTAFVIPLEEKTKENQQRLRSIDYLNEHKIATKRIYNPTKWHQSGRMWFSGKWIPTLNIITVDRAPVTREWTADNSGTSENKKEDIEVESRESIGFGVKITCTASVPEEEAAEFLYYYKGRSLDQVMDRNLRSFIQDILTSEFGARSLTDCQNQRSAVFGVMKDSTIAFFSQRGIKIDNIGAAGGFDYADKTIQISINEKFQAEMKIQAAQNEVDAAKKFTEASSLIRQQKELDADIEIRKSEAALRLNWDGHLGDGWTVIEGGKGGSIPGSIILGGRK